MVNLSLRVEMQKLKPRQGQSLPLGHTGSMGLEPVSRFCPCSALKSSENDRSHDLSTY